MSNGKVREGEEAIKQAEKYLKTSMFKWNPDYDSAGDCYSRAATAFKVGGDKQKAIDAFDKACNCYKEMRTLFQAARMLEQAMLICRDLDQAELVVTYAERAALLFRQDGSHESAAQVLEKAAKIVETGQPDLAIGLYLKAADTVGYEDRPREAAEFLGRAARLMVRCKNFDDAVESLQKSLVLMGSVEGGNAAAGRSAAGLVIVQLVRDDHIAAMRAYETYGGYCDGEAAPALRSLLEAIDEMDGDAAKEIINGKAIKNLDIDFARLAKHIPLPDSTDLEAAAAKLGAQQAERAKKAAEEAKSSASPPAQVVQEEKELEQEAPKEVDDDEDELC